MSTKTVPSEGKQPLPGKGLRREHASTDDLIDRRGGTLDPAQPHVTGEAADHPTKTHKEKSDGR